MKKHNKILIGVALFLAIISTTRAESQEVIVIENEEFALSISPAGYSVSLIHKATGEECLYEGAKEPLCGITEYRPYDNELFLTYPAKERTFYSNKIWREGDNLKVQFEEIAYTATIALNIKKDYIGFKLAKLDYNIESIGVKRATEIDEFALLRLPVKERTYFGEWLNVAWDDKVAVNLLGADIATKIDAYQNRGYRLLYAGMESNVKLMNTEAVLITTTPDAILDNIDVVERDYNLPLGAQSRKSEAYKHSYYELRNATTENIDQHLNYAKQGGFKMVVIYYTDFASSMGHFPWNSKFPNGMEDLKFITDKIRKAGMIPGFHIHYNKAAKNDPYVSPVPDHRLNLVRTFTLSNPIDATSTTIYVEENPIGSTMEDGRRFLKIGNELITYQNYTTEPPYAFTGCERGVLGSTKKEIEKGYKFGLLDVDTWPLFVRFDQNTSIQAEVAERIGDIYREAGFEFVYFDGAEDVHPPYWYNVSKAQLIVYDKLTPKPILSEGALKSHFGWHILTRGNAFDLFRPEDIREATNRYTIHAAKYIAQDFSSINFGWNDYLAPSEKSIGMQPDMYEYICSRGAGWNCPIALMGKLDELQKHPRTSDNLEVIRNWEEFRHSNQITDEIKHQLQSTTQEHILIKDKKGKFSLYPYEQLETADNNSLRAFIFEKNNKNIVLFWHPRGKGNMFLPISSGSVKLYDSKQRSVPLKKSSAGITVPVDKRLFLELDMPKEKVTDIFKKASVTNNSL